MKSDITVVIPLYNKEKDILETLQSVLGQTVMPNEIIVVNDGSTDGGAAVVNSLNSPLVRIVEQSNSGVSIARNRGISEAKSRYVALLDGDDRWESRFLEKMTELIEKYPGCGIYASGFNIIRGGKRYLAKSPAEEGIVEDFFKSALNHYICWSSAVTIDKSAIISIGGFPEGMKIGEDLYTWIKIASDYKVCFTPEPLSNYEVMASNRSAHIYTPEKTKYSFEDLYRAEEGNSNRNEYIARCAINKAITLSAKGDTEFGKRTAKFFAYTIKFRRALNKLRIMNSLPSVLRPTFNNLYNKLAWMISKKGF